MENNENNGVTTQNTQAEEKNYKQEYENQKLEIERLKNAISKTNSENAEYKRKAEAKMTDDEKRAKELQDALDAKAQAESEVAQLRLEKDFATHGFSAEETEKLIKGNFAVKDIADIIKARCDEAVKSAKAEATKTSTAETLLGNGSAKGEEKSDFQKHQESKQKSENIVKL